MSYVVTSKQEKEKMLKTIGISSINDLYKDVDQKLLLKEPLNIEKGISEFEVLEDFEEKASRNKIYKSSFRGAGSYKHLIPEVVKHLSALSGFVTSYTPYQAEISQGNLQSIFEYQSEICDLFDMEVTNASIYDGASATCEAIMMSLSRNKNTILISKGINPNYIETIKAYSYARDLKVVELDLKNGLTDLELLKNQDFSFVSSVVVQSPNFYGLIEDVKSINEIAKENKAECIDIVNPISLGLLKTPRELGVEISCGEAQPLGLDQGFGGPYLGFIATTKKYLRKIPGRIVGQTVDMDDKVSYVLTLQAREQHIRREKASSSICSNQALSALRCSIYMVSLGKQGLIEVSKRCFNNAHYLKEQITKLVGFKLKYENEFFHEFVIVSPIKIDIINEKLKENNIQGPYKISDYEMLICATEANRKSDMDKFIKILGEVAR